MERPPISGAFLHDRLSLERRLRAAKARLNEQCRLALTGDRAAGDRAQAAHLEVERLREQLKRLGGQALGVWAEAARIKQEQS